MRKLIIIILICAGIRDLNAQTITQKIATAYKQFEKDLQLKHAISSLYIIDAATGKVVFDKNSHVGLAPASSQKIITAATAFELLGKEFRFKTELGYVGEILSGNLDGNIIVKPNGDPTFGSWRWARTSEANILGNFVKSIAKQGIKNVTGSVEIFKNGWATQVIPDSWIVQDIGNYYGAGSSILSWRENQFEAILTSGNTIGDSVKITRYQPKLFSPDYISEVKSAKKGSGDNAYIYQNPNVIRGTIPIGESNFVIAGAMQIPSWQFQKTLSDTLFNAGIDMNRPGMNTFGYDINTFKTVYTHYSPSLDSIIYWFLKKSINLYGEALIKTMAYEKKGFGATDTGINIVKDFWKQKSLDPDEINIYDGSGLSPMNRVTTHAQVEVLKYAKKQNWFRYFYEALPDYNGMKLKSGTISDVTAFCGYHTSKDGKNYIISFIVNNYSGSSSTLVNKMYRVLDVLK